MLDSFLLKVGLFITNSWISLNFDAYNKLKYNRLLRHIYYISYIINMKYKIDLFITNKNSVVFII